MAKRKPSKREEALKPWQKWQSAIVQSPGARLRELEAAGGTQGMSESDLTKLRARLEKEARLAFRDMAKSIRQFHQKLVPGGPQLRSVKGLKDWLKVFKVSDAESYTRTIEKDKIRAASNIGKAFRRASEITSKTIVATAQRETRGTAERAARADQLREARRTKRAWENIHLVPEPIQRAARGTLERRQRAVRLREARQLSIGEKLAGNIGLIQDPTSDYGVVGKARPPAGRVSPNDNMNQMFKEYREWEARKAEVEKRTTLKPIGPPPRNYGLTQKDFNRVDSTWRIRGIEERLGVAGMAMPNRNNAPPMPGGGGGGGRRRGGGGGGGGGGRAGGGGGRMGGGSAGGGGASGVGDAGALFSAAKQYMWTYQLSSAVQDFAIVLQGGGTFDRAILGAANNLGVLASAAHPAVAALGTMGVVALPTIIAAITDASGQLNSFAGGMEDAHDAWSKQLDATVKMAEAQRAATEAMRLSQDSIRTSAALEKESLEKDLGGELLARAAESTDAEKARKQFVQQQVDAEMAPGREMVAKGGLARMKTAQDFEKLGYFGTIGKHTFKSAGGDAVSGMVGKAMLGGKNVPPGVAEMAGSGMVDFVGDIVGKQVKQQVSLATMATGSVGFGLKAMENTRIGKAVSDKFSEWFGGGTQLRKEQKQFEESQTALELESQIRANKQFAEMSPEEKIKALESTKAGGGIRGAYEQQLAGALASEQERQGKIVEIDTVEQQIAEKKQQRSRAITKFGKSKLDAEIDTLEGQRTVLEGEVSGKDTLLMESNRHLSTIESLIRRIHDKGIAGL